MCAGGCLCETCCAKAREFAFDKWGLDRRHITSAYIPPKPALVSRDGYWYHVSKRGSDA